MPKLIVGMPKGHVKNAGCYIANRQTIYLSDSALYLIDTLYLRRALLNSEFIVKGGYEYRLTAEGRIIIRKPSTIF